MFNEAELKLFLDSAIKFKKEQNYSVKKVKIINFIKSQARQSQGLVR